MKNKEQLVSLIKEFFRYVMVGGAAFVIDFCTLIVLKEFILPDMSGFELYVATTGGFISGLIFNYFFSKRFVFKSNTARSKSLTGFIIFTIIGVIGLGLTNLGMYIGVALLMLNYKLVKLLVTGIVLIWNYIGRKVLVFS